MGDRLETNIGKAPDFRFLIKIWYVYILKTVLLPVGKQVLGDKCDTRKEKCRIKGRYWQG
jgi:hypothetical protein